MEPSPLHGALTSLSGFRDASEDTQLRIVRALERAGMFERLDSGTVLLRDADVFDDVGYVLIEGTVAITRPNTLGFQSSAPDLLGEAAFLHPAHRRVATVTAEGPVSVFSFRWQRFFDELGQEAPRLVEPVRLFLQQHSWAHFND
jgi:CRP-like cAMP-binding protein